MGEKVSVTCHELAKRLGIQPCHVHANELVDLADAKDREGYQRRLEEIERDHGRALRDLASAHARRQVYMQTRYHRHNPWRAAWKEYKNQRGSE